MMEQVLKLFTLLFLCWPAHSATEDCSAEGIYPEPGSPDKFYVCSNVNGELNKVTLSCPPGNSYSPVNKQCEADAIAKYHLFSNHGMTDCLYNGMYCTDCQTMRICIKDGAGKYIKIKDVVCPNGTVCSTKHRQCLPNLLCPIREFHCTGTGVFPDPYDCTKVHACFENQHLPSQCPKYQVFDSALGRCTGNATCVRLPDCERLFQVGAWPNSQIFYICKYDDKTRTLAPELYNCPENKMFNPSTLECQNRTKDYNGTSTDTDSLIQEKYDEMMNRKEP